MKSNRIAAAVILLCLTQTFGCGSDGENNTTIITPSSNSASMKGVWVGRQGAVTTSAVVLADGDSWMVFQESGVTSRFAHIKMTSNGNSFGGSGKLYSLATGTSDIISAGGAFVEKQSLSAIIKAENNINPIDTTKFELAYDTQYETTANINDLNGSWKGTSDNKSASRTMTITAGAVTGTSTTGCTYTGTVKNRITDKALFDLGLTETCQGTSNTFTGIATVNAAKSGVSFTASTTDDKKGIIFMGAKQ
jgi:hypothetical protein